jgi:hypothetical protein
LTDISEVLTAIISAMSNRHNDGEVGTSETSVSFYELHDVTSQKTADSHLHTHRSENLKSENLEI